MFQTKHAGRKSEGILPPSAFHSLQNLNGLDNAHFHREHGCKYLSLLETALQAPTETMLNWGSHDQVTLAQS